jgi:hypothetical protein
MKHFTNTQQFLSPWPGRGLDHIKDSFNYWLSHSCQCVEHGFGIMTKCLCIFWHLFNFSFHCWSTAVIVSMKMHNLCLDRNLGIPVHHFTEDGRDSNEWVVYDNYRDDDILLWGHARGDCRRDITSKLEP